MKLKFERYTGMSCLYVRGPVDAANFRILIIGLDALINKQEDPLIVHLAYATLTPDDSKKLAEFKKKRASGKFAVHWVSPERGLGDYKNIELLTSRILTSKLKAISNRIMIDDEVFLLNTEILTLQEEIAKLGGTEESVKKIILENEILKAQRSTLNQAISWQSGRYIFQAAIPTDDAEIVEKTNAAIEELKKFLGTESPL